MFGSITPSPALDTVAHIIQIALTPIFLLSGIATLLNVFSARLARVADQVDRVTKDIDTAGPDESAALSIQLVQLRRRSLALDLAVVLGAVGGAATCGAVMILFVGALRDATAATILFALFGLAIICTLGAIVTFTMEMLMASIRIRTETKKGQRVADGNDQKPPRCDNLTT